MSSITLGVLFFVALGLVVLTLPLGLFFLTRHYDLPVVTHLRNHPRAIYVTQGVLMSGCFFLQLFGSSGTGSPGARAVLIAVFGAGAALAFVQAIWFSRRPGVGLRTTS